MRRLCNHFFLSTLFALLSIHVAVSQVFTEHIGITLPGMEQGSTAWGDYDNDGDLDLLLAGYSQAGNSAIIFQNEDGNFSDINAGLLGCYGGTAAWGDFDNDGDLDILLTGYSNSGRISKIYRNESGAFNDLNAGLPGVSDNSCGIWGDYDNDGDLDIFLCGNTGYDRISKLFRNDNSTFVEINAQLPGVTGSSAAWGDYDNDNDLDLLITGSTSSNERIAKIFRNDNGLFTDILAPLQGVYFGSAAWGDYDNDGDLDILLGGYSSSAGDITKVYKNSNGVFSDISAGLPGFDSGSLLWGDYDNDGDLDILISGYGMTDYFSEIYSNDNGVFTDINAGLPATQMGLSSWGDYDNDRDLDLILTGYTYTGPISKIYKNNISAQNTVPAAPSNLSYSVTGNWITMSWNKSTDAQTPQNGLSYNLYIGTSPGTVNRRSPMASVTNGFRRIVQGGFIKDNKWTIKRLPAGTYYWSVQAIDNTFSGSAFATQASFTVSYTNSIAPTADQVLKRNQPAGTLTVTESSTPSSRQWKYSTIFGGPYNQVITGATGTTCNVSFQSCGVYYVVCESVKGGVTYVSNQVKITVTDFIEQQGLVFTGVNSGNVVWGDYDDDGDLDILLTGLQDSNEQTAKIYRNDGAGFADIGALLPGSTAGDWGDYDNDGDLDLMLAEINNSRIYRNDNGVFNDINAGLIGVQYGSVDWGDFDNDGDQDIFLNGSTSGGFPVSRIYRNDDGNFIDLSAGIVDVTNGTGSWGDFDNDGDPDLLITGSGYARIYRNNSGFFNDIAAGLPSVGNGSGSWGDYDNDGDLDIVLTGQSSSGFMTKIFKNLDGNFSEISGVLPSLNNSTCTWGDLDNDGDLDLMISGSSVGGYLTRIFQNLNGTFSEFITDFPGLIKPSLAPGDVDKDGDLDILLTGQTNTGSITRIYKNFISIPNEVPLSPSGLKAVVSPNNVTLSWEKSTDNTTPQPGLTYNLYIGSSPGSSDRKSPMAVIPGGLKKTVQKGLQINSWTIRNLPSGTYYWSVQAIDNTFSGSAFSDESGFTVTYSNSIAPTADQTLVINTNGTALTVSEPSTADAHQWKYSNTSGGPYNQIIIGANGTSYTPNFNEWGVYYVVCESVKGDDIYTSNEVKVNLPVFSEITTTGFPGIYMGSMTWGDYDNDGYIDVLITGNNQAKVYKNNNGTFTLSATLQAVSRCSSAWGDYDNDGDLDILIIGTNARIYRNDSGTFTNISAGIWGMNYASAAWGDYDNDGDLDILCGGNYRTIIFRNDSGIFNDINAGLTGIYQGSVAWGDYDNDGDLDILITGNSYPGYVSIIYRNDGGYFTDIVAGLTGVVNGSGTWGDYDSDGDLDVLLAGQTYSAGFNTKIYRNDNGSFADINAVLPGVRSSSVAWCDYDNDGDLDCLITGNNQTLGIISKIFRNDGGMFNDINAGVPGVQYGTSAWGDYDNDGDMDLLLAGQRTSGYYSTLFRNNITVANSVPTKPSGLTSLPGSNKVTLSWNKSTDSKTLQNALSYNIYIGNGPGLINKKSPMASLAGGLRTIAQPGSIQKNTWTVRSLPAGTYYWSVQAVDNSFAGSTFAIEASFTIPFSSSVAPVASQTIEINQNGTILNVTESSVPSSRQWKYSTIQGGPYSQNIPGATGPSYTPNFSSFGVYYVVCESLYSSVAYISNEVRIIVPFFSEQTGITLEKVRSSSASWGDYDNDSDLDMIIIGTDESGISTARIYNNAGGNFVNINANLPEPINGSVAWGDYDNDGDLDILISGYTGSEITRIYRNHGGIFSDINAGIPGLQYGSSSWGDYDNDGDLDVLVSGSSQADIFQNNDGTFKSVNAGFVKTNFSSSSWGDYDNDGDLDVIITGLVGTDPVSVIYRNNNGIFADINAGIQGVSYSSVAWGDYDNDSDLDLLLTGMSSFSPVSKIYRNDNGIFIDISALLTGVYRSSASWGDYDNDGDLDIILTGNNTSDCITKIYRNDNGVFNDIREIIPGTQYSSVTWGDYDKDGDLDFLLTGQGTITSYNALIFRNNSLVSNSVPTVPLNLQSVQEPNRVTLTWDKSTDSKTPQSGLSYNFYIGSVSGSVNKKSPMAGIPGGFRKIVQKGNSKNSWTIKNLPAGIYYWSAQSIDNSFSGSAFATETSFTISYSNSIAPISDQTLSINQNGTTLTVTESSPADSRQWKYSNVKGGPYDNIILEATGNSFMPNFDSWGTYYVVCVSVKNSVSYISNEVKVVLPIFLEQKDISLGGVSRGVAAWGDYDDDNDLDLFTSGYYGSGYSSTLYRNDNGSFIDLTLSLPGLNLASAAWGDFDNDNDLDLVLTGNYATNNNISKIFRNDSGIFTDINAGLISVYGGSVDWGDFDNDGDLDLLLTGCVSSSNYVSKIYRNDSGTFTDFEAVLPGVTSASAVWGDYDNDGDLDILLTGMLISQDRISKVYRNENNSFNDINADLTGVSSGSASWSDFDNDGDLDILITGVTFANEKISKIYRNNGGIFSDINVGLPGIVSSSARWGDFDNNGTSDILLSGVSSMGYISKIFRNTGEGFIDIGENLPGLSTSSVAWGDYDGDSDLDIILTGNAGSTTSYSKIFKNTITNPNSAASPPANLSNLMAGTDKVVFNWDRSTDIQTPQNSLSYNIRLGTTPGGSEIISPMSSAASGYRKKPSAGNAGFLNSGYYIRNLGPGTYYWNVQAVDQAFSGSEWSAMKTFVILSETTATSPSNITSNSFSANWNAASGATGYHIDVSTDPDFFSMVTGYNDRDVGNVVTFNLTGLNPKTRYYYRIRVYNELGLSPNSNVIDVLTMPYVPVTPSGLSGKACNDIVILNWTPVTEANFLRYVIYFGTASDNVTRIDSTENGVISETTISLPGLAHGQTYYFRIKAVISSGERSLLSTPVSVKVSRGVVPRIKAKWGDVLICYNQGDSISTFQWYKGTSEIPNATKQYYVTNKSPGSYNVMTTDKDGCKNNSNIINISSSKTMAVYPNPASESFMIRLNSEVMGKTIITIFNSAGNNIMEYQADKREKEFMMELPATGLQQGIYTIEVMVNEEELNYSRVIIMGR